MKQVKMVGAMTLRDPAELGMIITPDLLLLIILVVQSVVMQPLSQEQHLILHNHASAKAFFSFFRECVLKHTLLQISPF